MLVFCVMYLLLDFENLFFCLMANGLIGERKNTNKECILKLKIDALKNS